MILRKVSVTSAQRCEAEEIRFLEKQKNQGLMTAAPKGARMEHKLFSMCFLLLCCARLSICPRGAIIGTNM